MSQLYTVNLTREEIVCTYDDRGLRVGETKRAIPQTYGDLPYVTALRYQTQFPDSNVVITAQQDSSATPRNLATEPTYRYASRKTTAPVTPKIDKIVAAATSGSLSEAL
jgi:hypothetical protein